MSATHFTPAQSGEFGYIIVGLNDGGEAVLERSPLIGYTTRITENKEQELIVQTLPVCTLGESYTPEFIQRYEGTFMDSEGEHICHSLTEMMSCFGLAPKDLNTLPPENVNELSEYIWQSQQNPQD
ncbi:MULTISPECIES: hypothetical protein [Aeromonas]|uniref:hypothetical protein n=1 Tax=Aeromonas TaxID=642 RepID=UPI001B3367C3|nr:MULTISPECIES: hypothetical protein [Aeromonas]MBP4079283.1 hypothetical protein [Aeromonas sp. MrichA-1]